MSAKVDKSNKKIKPFKQPASPAYRQAGRRRKLILLAIYLVLVVIFIIVGGNANYDLANQPYTNNESGFSIKPPKDWAVKAGDKEGVVVTFTDTDKGDSGKITINSTPTDLDLAGFVESAKKELPQTASNYSEIGTLETTVQGQPAYIIDAEAVVENVWKKARIMIEVKGGQAYVVSASTNLADWNSFDKSIIYASLKSFKLTKWSSPLSLGFAIS